MTELVVRSFLCAHAHTGVIGALTRTVYPCLCLSLFLSLSLSLRMYHNRFDHWLFQFAFCATAVTIPCGSMAERTQFTSYILYSLVVSVWLYPVPVHCTPSVDLLTPALASISSRLSHFFPRYFCVGDCASSPCSPFLLSGVWSSTGWLRNLGENGLIDVAGDSVVHLLGGSIGYAVS